MKIIETDLNFKILKYNNIPKLIVLHHSAHSNCNIFDINRWHKERGWSGIGYHFFLTKDGIIYRGRPENAVGVHCKGYNTNTLGVCVQGNYMSETTTLLQEESIINLCIYLCKKYNINIIKAHKESVSTECPGVYFQFKKIRKKSLEKMLNHFTYTVNNGDTLWLISKKFNISVKELKILNGLTENIIYQNQILRIF